MGPVKCMFCEREDEEVVQVFLPGPPSPSGANYLNIHPTCLRFAVRTMKRLWG